VSCFVDLALKRRCVVNVIDAGNRMDRAMMHVHFTVEVGETVRFWREHYLLARLWRARDIVPFV
jgi:translation elongation factor EF-Tu-like GTPase